MMAFDSLRAIGFVLLLGIAGQKLEYLFNFFSPARGII